MLDAQLAAAFTAGMIATVNPCGFAMLPAYLGFFLGRDDDELRARAARLRERAVQQLETLLRLGARDGEGVVGALGEEGDAAADDPEQDDPRDEHAPRVAVGPSAEGEEDGGHGRSWSESDGFDTALYPIHMCIVDPHAGAEPEGWV